MEEVFEAFAKNEPEKQREEMVQVATLAVQIIEYLDRRMEAKCENEK
jgi:NTP pyrophosphatase (non-canonical NTP hydrolase)